MRTVISFYVLALARAQTTRVLSSQSVITIAGGGASGTLLGSNNGVGTNAGFNQPYDAVVGAAGVMYVTDNTNHKIRVVYSNRTVTTLAGGGATGSSSGSANGIGTNAAFNGPQGIALSSTGVLYIADRNNNKIRFLLPNATVGTLAGGGATGSAAGSSNGIGTAALFTFMYGIAIDAANVVYVADFGNNKIRRIGAFTAWFSPSTAVVTTLAGGGSLGTSSGAVNGMGTNALFSSPNCIVLGSLGALYVSDTGNNKLHVIAANGNVTTIAGGGAGGTTPGSNDALGTAALFNAPYGIAIDVSSGVLYAADANNVAIRKIFPNTTVVTIAGGSSTDSVDGIGTAACFNGPRGLAVNSTSGVVYVADSGNHKLRAIFPFSCAPGQYITDDSPSAKCAACLAGTFSAAADYRGCTPCAAGSFNNVTGATAAASCAACAAGTFTPSSGATTCLTSPAAPQSVVTIAGGGAVGNTSGSIDGVVGTNAAFNLPTGVAIDAGGIWYVADFFNHRIRAVYSNRTVVTLAGGGASGTTAGSANGVGTNALLNFPNGVAVSATGVVYVADQNNNKVRFVLPNATVGTLAGGGAAGNLTGSTNGLGTAALFSLANGVAVDLSNVVYVADYGNHKIRRISAFTAWSSPSTAAVTTLAGGGLLGTASGSVDGMGTNALFFMPRSVAVSSLGIVFVADQNNNKIRAIAPDGTVTTLAGGGADGITAGSTDAVGNAALFNSPSGVAIDASGAVYVGDRDNNKLRKVFPNLTVVTMAGGGTGGVLLGSVNGIGTAALFNGPRGVAVNSTSGVVYVADGNHKVRAIFPFSCAPGQYITDDSPSAKCAACPAGSFSDSASYRECPFCGAGTFSNSSGSSFCQACPAGTYSSISGAISNASCAPCLAGTFSPTAGAKSTAACVPCSAGRYSVTAGATTNATCTLCPVGSFCTGGILVPCYPATACSVAGLSAQPQCDWRVTTLAGSASVGAANGVGTSATFSNPTDVVADAAGLIYIIDAGNHLIRTLSSSAEVGLLAGSGSASWADGTGALASFNSPKGAAFYAPATLFVADCNNNRVRGISLPAGVTSTVAGAAAAAYLDATGTAARFSCPNSIAVDSAGTLYVSDSGNFRIRTITPSGVVGTLAGTGVAGLSNGIGTSASFSASAALAISSAGILFVSDMNNNQIRAISLTGQVTNFSGTGAYSSIDGVASSASFMNPAKVHMTSQGYLIVGEWQANSYRLVSPIGTASALAGGRSSSNFGYVDAVGTAARFWGSNAAIENLLDGTLIAVDGNNHRIRQLTNACVPCPASYYCFSGAPVLCPAGSFCPPSSINATACPAGTYSAAIGASSNATCTLCPSGVYGNTTRLTTPACSGNCTAAPGTYCPVGFTSPTALVCPIGSYCTGGTAPSVLCNPVTACSVAGLSAQPPCYWNVSSLAGSGSWTWADGVGAAASFANPIGVSWSFANSTLLVGDFINNRARAVNPSTRLVRTLAGGASGAYADGVGTAALLNQPHAVVADAQGNVLICDAQNNRLRMIFPNQSVITFAGSGTAGGLNGVGVGAQFYYPTDVAINASGAVGYVVEQFGNRIRTLALSTRQVGLLAGSGLSGFADNANGALAMFNSPTAAVLHPGGVLYVAEWGGNRVRVVSVSSGATATLAGNGTTDSIDGVGTLATFNAPRGIALDASASTLYVSEFGGHRIRSIVIASALVRTIAGNVAAYADGFGVGASFNAPMFLALSPSGAVFSADYGNNRIRQLTCVPCPASFFCSSGAPVVCPAGSYCPVNSANATACPAGTYSAAIGASSSAMCTPCAAASFSTLPGANSSATCKACPVGSFTLAVGASSVTSCVTVPTIPQSVVTVAGGGVSGFLVGSNNGDGTNALFASPPSIVIDAAGVLYVADSSNHKIRAVYSNRTVITFAGGDASGTASGSVNGVGSNALFSSPNGVAVSAAGVVYVADQNNNKVRFVLPNATVGTLAGGGATGVAAGNTNGVGTAALFSFVYTVAVDASNIVYAFDNNQKIRRISAFTAWSSPATAVVTTLAGGGILGTTPGSVDGIGTNALFFGARGLIATSLGFLFVADQVNHKVRAIAPDGTVTTIAGGGASGSAPGSNDAMGTAALFNFPSGVAVDASGTVYVTDRDNQRVRKIFPNSTVVTIAGGGATGTLFGSVNGIGTVALFNAPRGITVNSSTDVVYVAEATKVRAIFPFSCAPGQYITDDSPSARCMLCPPGSYSTVAEYRECLLCPIGTYSNATGANASTTCVVCPCSSACTTTGVGYAPSCSLTPSPTASLSSGTFSPTGSQSQTMSKTPSPLSTPTSTPSGGSSPSRSPTVSATPSASPTRTFSPTATVTQSPTRTLGVATSTSSSSPTPTPSNSVSGTVAALTTSPTSLPTLTATPSMSPTSSPTPSAMASTTPSPSFVAIVCPPGSGRDAVLNVCNLCDAGTFSATASTAGCTPRASGSYAYLTGSTACLPCEPGFFCPAGCAAQFGISCGLGNFCPPSSSVPIACPAYGSISPSGLVSNGPAFDVDKAACQMHCFWVPDTADGAWSECFDTLAPYLV